MTHALNLVDQDPFFCGSVPASMAPTTEGDYTLAAGSPCLPEASPCDSLIGALGFGCAVVSVLPPPEEEKHVKTAIGAERAKQARGEML